MPFRIRLKLKFVHFPISDSILGRKELFMPLSCFKSIYMHLGARIGSDIYLPNLWLPTTFLSALQFATAVPRAALSRRQSVCIKVIFLPSLSLALESILIYSTICPYAVSFLNYSARNIFLKRDIVKSSIEKCSWENKRKALNCVWNSNSFR